LSTDEISAFHRSCGNRTAGANASFAGNPKTKEKNMCLIRSSTVGSIALAVITVLNGLQVTAHGAGPAVAEKPKAGTKDESTLSYVNNVVHINSGLMLLNPYKITTSNDMNNTTTHLTDGDAQARFFIEVAANYTWAWNAHRRWDWVASRAESGGCYGWLHKIRQGDRPVADGIDEFGFGPPDFHGRLSYIAQDSKNTSAAAIIGTGEFGMEVTLGLPLYQSINVPSRNLGQYRNAMDLYTNTTSAHWFGFVASWSGTTDGRAFDIHSRYFAGLGYRAAFKSPWEGSDASGREIALNFQIGGASVDAVQFTDKFTRQIAAESPGIPDYGTDTLMGVEAEIYIPINKSLNAVVGARFYPLSNSDSPNSWNAYVGLTVPLTKLAGLFE
jgi:hypothetical protein